MEGETMPEFILDHGSVEAARAFNKLDAFTQGYIEAMFFTETGTGDDDDLEDATVAELAPETLESIQKDCADFQRIAAIWLELAYERDYDAEQAGRDFWFTRNGHGVGFWARDELEAEGLGHNLTEWCNSFREVYVCRGDDDLIYVM